MSEQCRHIAAHTGACVECGGERTVCTYCGVDVAASGADGGSWVPFAHKHCAPSPAAASRFSDADLRRLCDCGHDRGDHRLRVPEPCGVCGCDAFNALAPSHAAASGVPLEEIDVAAEFNRWMSQHIEGRYAMAGHYSHGQLRTLMYLAFQAGRSASSLPVKDPNDGKVGNDPK